MKFVLQAVDTTVLGLSKEESEKKPYIASMGVYIFKKEILLNLLRYMTSIYTYLSRAILMMKIRIHLICIGNK